MCPWERPASCYLTVTVSFVDETSNVTEECRYQQMPSGGKTGERPHVTNLSPDAAIPPPAHLLFSEGDGSPPDPDLSFNNHSSPVTKRRPEDRFELANTSPRPSRVSVGFDSFHDTTNLAGFQPYTSPSAKNDSLSVLSPPNSNSSRQAAPTNVSDIINAGDKHDGVSPEFLHLELYRGNSGLHLYEDRMLLPFGVAQEALLFHHYMEQLAAMVRLRLSFVFGSVSIGRCS